MSSKKDPESAASENIKTLCILMTSMTDFNPDFNAVAADIGIAQAKNVPRKINTIIEPAGYTLKKGKIIKIGSDEAPPATPANAASKSSESITTGQAQNDDDDQQSATPKAAKTPRARKPKAESTTGDTAAATKKKTPAKRASPVKKTDTATATKKSSPKKRKLEETIDDPVDEDDAKPNAEADSPATKAIKACMDSSGDDDKDGNENDDASMGDGEEGKQGSQKAEEED